MLAFCALEGVAHSVCWPPFFSFFPPIAARNLAVSDRRNSETGPHLMGEKPKGMFKTVKPDVDIIVIDDYDSPYNFDKLFQNLIHRQKARRRYALILFFCLLLALLCGTLALL